MIRKIQKIGSSYYLSLPKTWVEKLKLDKGAEINIELDKNGRLNILPPKTVLKEEREITLNLDKDIDKKILSYYLLGYDNIRIISKNKISKEEREKIDNIIKKLSGVEIFDESHTQILIQSLINEESIDPIKIIHKMNSLSSTIYVDVIKSLINKEEIHISLNEREKEIDKLYFLLVRQIRSIITKPYLLNKLNLTYIDCLDLRIAGLIIEKISDEAIKLSEKVKKNGINNVNALNKIVINLQKLQEKALISLLKKKPSHIEEIKKEIENISNQLNSLSIPPQIINSLQNICELIIDICDLITYK